MANEEIVIWHNPRCSKSREALKLLESEGLEPKTYRYLDEKPTKEQIEEVLKMTGLRAREIMRTKEAVYKELGLIDYLADFICLSGDGGMDIGYVTELDPLWQNDIWASIVGPEAYLVANPVAQTACMADAVSSAAGFPLDPLWWCIGSWGSAFPMTQNVKDYTTPMETQGAITARMLMKMHRQLMLWGSIGEAGLCQSYPMPVMRKSQYGIFPVYPFLGWPYRIPIGRSGLIWDRGMDNPANMQVGAWMIYRKRDCCAF